MDDGRMGVSTVAPFRTVEFRDRAEFVEWMRKSESIRGDRWLYEQSLATLEDAVVLKGTCGLCLTEASFTASTRNGDLAAGGRVPNWREELVCDCRQRLSNRQRALLHYLLASELLQPWMRVLGLGDLGALALQFKSLSQSLTCWSGAIDLLGGHDSRLARGHHLVVSIEQVDASWIRGAFLSAVADQLLDGGRLVFTTPFDVASDGDSPAKDAGPIGWNILSSLRERGFIDAKACLYWSEELGYLGPLNFIFDAAR